MLTAPNGAAIIGTAERLTGTAGITNLRRLPDGEVDFDWDGGTDVDWDSQETVEIEGETVFVDENGDEWRASMLVEQD